MDRPPKLAVCLCLAGDFVPAELTTILNIVPDQTWGKGDSIQRTALKRKEAGWLLREESECWEISDPMHRLLSRIQPNLSRIKTLLSERHVRAELSCRVDLREDERAMPALFFDAQIILQIAELGATLDIDII